MEHGAGDSMTMLGQLQAMNGSGVVPLVRAPGNDRLFIKRTLDAGALGLVVPDINTQEEAEAAYRAVKYHPSGVRGISGYTRAGLYGMKESDALMQSANDRTMEQAQEKYARGYQFLSLMSGGPALGKIATDLMCEFKESFR